MRCADRDEFLRRPLATGIGEACFDPGRVFVVVEEPAGVVEEPHPWIAWGVDALAILLILIAAPITDWNKLVSRFVTFAVLIGLTEAIRRRASAEHPEGGWRWDELDIAWQHTPPGRLRPRRSPPLPPGVSAAAPAGDAIGQLERLAALHDRRAITNEEFERMKATLVPGSPSPGG